MYSFRPFGWLESDLSINFGQRSRPELVTQILRECLHNPPNGVSDPEHVWELTVGERIEALLRIAFKPAGPEFMMALNCLNQNCRQKIELELAIQKLVDTHSKSSNDRKVVVTLGERQLTLRKPTGRDQLRWLQDSWPDESTAMKNMIQTLIVGTDSENPVENFSDEETQLINQALQKADPLVDFEVTVQCPYCDEAFPYEVDLQEIGLAALKRIQNQVLHVIHRLASKYHWTEHQIIALPPWRREQYLGYLASESSV